MAKESSKTFSTTIGNLTAGRLYRNLSLSNTFFSLSSGSLTEKSGMVLLSKTLEDSITMMNSSLVVNKILFKSAYVDKVPLNSFIQSKSPLNVTDVYKKVKDSTNVTNCVQSLYTLKGKNVFLFNFNYLEKLDVLNTLINRNNRINFIKELLINNINKLINNNYKTINFVIDIKDFYQENFSLTNYNNLGILLLNAITSMIKEERYSKLLTNNVYLIVKDPKSNMGCYMGLHPKVFDETAFVGMIKRSSVAYQKISRGDSDYITGDTVNNSISLPKTSDLKKFYFIGKVDATSVEQSNPIFSSVKDAVEYYVKNKLNDSSVEVFGTGNEVRLSVTATSNGNVEEQIRAYKGAVHQFNLPVVEGTGTPDPTFVQEYFDIALPIIKLKKAIPTKDRSSVIFDLTSSEDVELVISNGKSVPLTKGTDLSTEDVLVRVKFNYTEYAGILADFAAKEALNKLYKDLKINVNSIPLSAEEKSLIDEIHIKLIEQLTTNDNNGVTAKELVVRANELLMSSPDIASIAGRLADERVVHIDSIKSASLITALKDKQANALVNIDGKPFSLADKISEVTSRSLESREFTFTTLNKAIKSSTTSQFRSSYNDKLYEQDMFNIFTSFHQSEDIPIFVQGIDIRDDSNAYNRVNMLEVKFLMPNGKPQTTRVQVPKVSSDGYLFLNGSKKLISNQMVSLPIVKVWSSGEDVVRFVTNYNKIFVSRVNGALSPKTDAFRKTMLTIQKDGKLNSRSHNIRFGSSTESNHGYINSLEYDEIAGYMFTLRIGDVNLSFSRRAILEELEKNGINYELLKESIDPEKYFPIGFSNTSVIWSDEYGVVYRSSRTARKSSKSDDVLVHAADDIYGLVQEMLATSTDLGKYLDTMQPAKLDKKKYAYSAVKVVGVRMPLIGFLGYKEGVTSIFDRYSVGYEFVSNGKEPANTQLKTGIKFADGYLFFDDSNVVTSLLVNGLRSLNPEGYNFSDYEAKGEAYDNFFTNVGKPRMGKALSNFYTLFIDPITKEILEDHKIPSDIIGSFLYCNTLLQYPGYQKKNDMTTYRVRNSELINALLYKIIASNIEAYRRAGRGESSTAGLTLPSNALIKELLESPIVEDVPILNPIREAETLAGSTYKGFGGSPMGHAKGTEEVRAYDPSMRGIYGVTTPDNSNTGVTRKLAMNSNIRNLRGYLKIDPKGEFNATNMLTVGELLSPFTFTHADPPRKHTCGFQ